MDIFRFSAWNIYKEAKQLFKLVIELTNRLPQKYKYSIGDQVVTTALDLLGKNGIQTARPNIHIQHL